MQAGTGIAELIALEMSKQVELKGNNSVLFYLLALLLRVSTTFKVKMFG